MRIRTDWLLLIQWQGKDDGIRRLGRWERGSGQPYVDTVTLTWRSDPKGCPWVSSDMVHLQVNFELKRDNSFIQTRDTRTDRQMTGAICNYSSYRRVPIIKAKWLRWNRLMYDFNFNVSVSIPETFVRRSLFSCSSGSCHDRDVTRQGIGRLKGWCKV